MTWRRYKKNPRNLLLLENFFGHGAISYISPIQRPRYFSSSYAYIKKRITIVFREKGNLSAPHRLTCFLNIETWKHSPIVLIPIFLAPPYVPTKLKLFTSYSLATRSKHEEPKRPTLPLQRTSL